MVFSSGSSSAGNGGRVAVASGAATGGRGKSRAGATALPHTGWGGQRTVAYVWHLSKAWRPEWGGALYWAQNDHDEATYPAV